ncbi:hypothetical protein CFAM422_012992, partial [Trichoderma lentiforme]
QDLTTTVYESFQPESQALTLIVVTIIFNILSGFIVLLWFYRYRFARQCYYGQHNVPYGFVDHYLAVPRQGKPGACTSGQTVILNVSYFVSVPNTFTEFTISVVPIFPLHHVQIPKKLKRITMGIIAGSMPVLHPLSLTPIEHLADPVALIS